MKFFASAKAIHTVAVFSIFALTVIFHAHSTGMTGVTRKNGNGCTCHGSASTAVTVQLSGPDTLQPGQTGQYSLTITGGPLVRGGTDIAASAGSLIAGTGMKLQNNELTHTAPAVPAGNKVTFQFSYQAPSTASACTLFANGNSVNFDNGSSGDQWNFASNKIVQVLAVTPVELTSLSASRKDGAVELKWSTASEKNNRGFSIYRSSDRKNWQAIGFMQGKGDCACISTYSFSDNEPGFATAYYKLEQLDYNGSKTVYEIESSFNPDLIQGMKLLQNYPNPFNPETRISYHLNAGTHVTLLIYNAIGRQVTSLVNEVQAPGFYTVSFKAGDLPSGIYYSKLITENYSEVKNMLLIK